ncbi:MAG: glycine--tRNA ligase subunit beta, partial [Pseudomonadota bacterium]|nr:glycine--tRNA ligase subunit beta [Pseudomonadota bacterium]
MADLLIEIICEEIPARMQARAAADLERLMLARLKDAGLAHGPTRHFVSPRHLALYIDGLAERQEDVSEERRGPRADAPDQAISGFLKSTGLTRDQLVEEDTPKGRFLFARIEKAGAAASELLPAMITGVLAEFPWPKSQRWGATRFRWVRPLHRVNVLFGGAPLAGELDLGGASLAFTATSRGHYFEHAGDIDLTGVADADDYVARLRGGHVMVDHTARRAALLDGASALATKAGTTLRVNEGLVDEVCGLVEWPTPLFGTIEDRFMALPDEVLEASIRAH